MSLGSHLPGILIAFTLDRAVSNVGRGEGHLGADADQADLGLVADLQPLLLGHSYELGTAMDELAQVVQEEVGLASPLLKLLADATVLVRNRR